MAKIQEIHVGQQVIIAGDFDLIMDTELDSLTYKHRNNPKARLEVFNFIENLNLKDVLGKYILKKPRYSWRNKTPIKHARLDFSLASESLKYLKKKILEMKVQYVCPVYKFANINHLLHISVL